MRARSPVFQIRCSALTSSMLFIFESSRWQACCVQAAEPMLTATKKPPGGTMHHPLRAATSVALNLALSLALGLALGLALAVPFPFAARAQAPVAVLTGLVSSAEEAAMEGVLVSATRA